jgi:DNA-binding NarL/FixJ family response regulator
MTETAATHVAGHSQRLLVGRTEELAALERMLEGLDRGRPEAAALVGEPGIGKSRLLAEVAKLADLRGHLVLFGSASEMERELPFSVFTDALDDYLASLGPGWYDPLGRDVRAELGHVFPALGGLEDGPRMTLQQERYLTHRAIRALLEHLARTRPLLLALDDFHWADPASIELFGALLRRPPGAAVAAVVALRRRPVPERLASALQRAQQAGTLAQIELEGLTHVEAGTLLGETVDTGQLAALMDETGGNPLYLEQLARSLGRLGRPVVGVASPPTGLGVPAAVAAALTDELVRVSGLARLLLEGAAVAGDPFDLDQAVAAAQTSETDARESIDELLEADLVRQTNVPRRFRFRHPIVRRAIYESTRAGWRLGAHERCADALATQGAPAVARAHHIERYAAQGDATAVAVLRAAGDATARLAPASASHWFAVAFRLLPHTAPAGERMQLLLARAGTLAATGRLDDSRATLLDCIDLAQQAAPEWRVRATTACASMEHLLGLRKEAHRHLSDALADLEETASEDAVALMIELAASGLYGSEAEAMRTWADRAVATARPLGDPALIAAALAARASASAAAGDPQWAQVHCDEATDLVDALPDEQLAGRLGTLADLAAADLFLDRFPAATRHAQRALDIGRSTGQGDLVPLVVAMLGGSLWVQGRPREAEELFEGAVESARLAGNTHGLAWVLFNHSIAALAAGDLDLALVAAEESVELEREMEQGLISATAAAVLATALLEAGDAQRSVREMVAGAGGHEVRLIGGGWRARFLEVHTRALLATGNRSAAERAMAEAHACAMAVGLPSAEGLAGLASAYLQLDAGDAENASVQALAAVQKLSSVHAVWDAARARVVAAQALSQAGDRASAVHQLNLAAAAFDSFGAHRYRDQAERQLRRLGQHAHRRPRADTQPAPGLETLSARELEIARLVVDRRTNPQIAAELFLSQKTVESHLRNIFIKLELSDRVTLARTIERADAVARAARV